MIDAHHRLQAISRLYISDPHLFEGDDCLTDVPQLLTFLEEWLPAVEVEAGIIGDLGECVLAKWQLAMRTSSMVVCAAAQHLLRHHPLARLRLLTGNHDWLIGEILRGYGNIIVHDRVREPIDAGDDVHLIHSEAYDRWDWFFRAEWTGNRAVRKVTRFFDRRFGHDEKGLEYHRAKAEAVVKKLPAGSALIHGHTHTAMLKEVPVDGGVVTWGDCGTTTNGGIDFIIQLLDGSWEKLRWTQ